MEKNTFDCQFGFRVDIDTVKGFVHGVPRLLAILSNSGIKATFALTTGPDRSLFNAINLFPPLAKFLGINRKLSEPSDWKGYFPNIINQITNLYTFKTGWITNPYDRTLFIRAEEKYGIVKAIESRSHEIILHGHDHFKWANCLEKLSYAEQEDLLNRGITEFRKIVGRNPRGFAAPAFNITPNLLPLLKEKGFSYCSNYSSNYLTRVTTPSVNGKDCCIEIPVINQPLYGIYREYITKGHIDSTIEKVSKMNVKILFFYLHAGLEGFLESNIMIELFYELKRAFSTHPIKIIDYVNSIGS